MSLAINLDRHSGTLLSQQMASEIADLVLSGAVQPGHLLPASRVLAKELGVGRTTVVDAYGWLTDHGYVETRQGSGTRVRHIALAGASNETVQALSPPAFAAPVPNLPIDFRPGLPDLARFPRREWQRAIRQASREVTDADLGYGDPLGYGKLRRAIASYLHRARGVATDWRSVVVTAGAAQSVDLLLRALPHYRDLIVESPVTLALKTLAASHKLKLHPIATDAKGLRTALLPACEGPWLAHVTPSHQMPMGCVMAMDRRLDLVNWSVRQNAYIIEDDYDGEFNYEGRPPPPLIKLDARRVIYCGTFSKTLAPGLRLGFMVLPPSLIEPIADLKWWVDRGGPILEQHALAGWLESGQFERHVLRMRRVYRNRYMMLRDALTTTLGERVRLVGEAAGMHVVAYVRTHRTAADVAERSRELGVGIHPVEGAAPDGRADEIALVLGFGNVLDGSIAKGVQALAAAVD